MCILAPQGRTTVNPLRRGIKRGTYISGDGFAMLGSMQGHGGIVSKTSKEGVYVRGLNRYPTVPGGRKFRHITVFIPWQRVVEMYGAGYLGRSGPLASNSMLLPGRKAPRPITGTKTRTVKRRRGGKLSKAAFLRRMALGRAKAARRRYR